MQVLLCVARLEPIVDAGLQCGSLFPHPLKQHLFDRTGSRSPLTRVPRARCKDEYGAWIHAMARGQVRLTVFPRPASLPPVPDAARTGGPRESSRGPHLPSALDALPSAGVDPPWFDVRVAAKAPEPVRPRLQPPGAPGEPPLSRSMPIEASALRGLRIAVVRYIDAYPAAARTVARAEAYCYGRAARWTNGSPPRWLSRE